MAVYWLYVRFRVFFIDFFFTYLNLVWFFSSSSCMSLPLIQQGKLYLVLNDQNAAAQQQLCSKLMDRYFDLLHRGHGDLLYEHMECEQLIPAKKKKTICALISVYAIFQSLAFPMLSTSIFSSNGSVYEQSAVFDSQFQLNQTALDIIGLPALTGSNAWANLTSNLAVESSPL